MRDHLLRNRILFPLAAVAIGVASPMAMAQGGEVSRGELERALGVAEDLSTAFEHVAEMVSPSVVNVQSTVRLASRERRGGQPFGDSPFREFFGDDFFERFRGGPGPRGGDGFMRRGQGTGFIVDADGVILTNNHVVENASEINVTLSDGRSYRAEVVGTDPGTDLAVIRIDAEDLPAVTFGDSDELSVGSWVVAVGNPFGLESTITAGIVSATGRAGVGVADYEDFIQTDAAINPGNSGGPLVNLRGEVVGVNTAIATRSGGNMGIGFAIPSNMATSIMDSLLEEGVVSRGWLGVNIQDLNPGLAESFGYGSVDGVLVSNVLEDTPADRAGLRTGDIITEFEGEPLEGTQQLRVRVASTPPGREVELTVFREGRERTVEVTLGELASEAPADRPEPAVTEELGMELRTLGPRLAERLGVDVEEGVAVTGVAPFSPAARAGLRARDVITHVHDERVRDVGAFRRALEEHDLEEGVRLTVRTGEAQRFLFLRAPGD